MKKVILISALVFGMFFFMIVPLQASVACKTNCRADEGVICLERGPCQPISSVLLKAAKECREGGPAMYSPVTKLLFVDILSEVMRLTTPLSNRIAQFTDEERYDIEAKLLAEKGINMFVGANPKDTLTREELTAILKEVSIEKNLGFSSGLPAQAIELNNEKFLIYDVKLYVDEGSGFEPWERKDNFEKSSASDKHYSAKVDACIDSRIVLGDGTKGKIPLTGSRLKASYKLFGREDEVVTECEAVMLLSNPDVSLAVRSRYSPSRVLTRANFVDLLIRTMHLEDRMPSGYEKFTADKLYLSEAEILAKNGITIFKGARPNDLLTRDELAKVLYDNPVVEVVGVSNGKENQSFELNNAGFMIYDLHAYVNEGVRDEEWNRKNNFMESSSSAKDYTVKLDGGNYASVYFGDNKKGKAPDINSPIKVSYRLYAPLTMLTEDDIICVLGKLKPVPETYIPPPAPPEFPPPTDGFDDPATHI